jgi:hypothetical protein
VPELVSSRRRRFCHLRSPPTFADPQAAINAALDQRARLRRNGLGRRGGAKLARAAGDPALAPTSPEPRELLGFAMLALTAIADVDI